MQQNTKDWIQYISAIAMLVSAITLAFWSFYKLSEVHGSVLAYVGEAIAFVAGVFGLALYAKHEIKKEFRKWLQEQDGMREEQKNEDEDGEI